MTEVEIEENVSAQDQPVEDQNSAHEGESEQPDNNANPFKTDKKMKRKKKDKQIAEETTNADDESVMPVPPPSKRQKKKEKRLQIVVRNKDKEIEKTILYLTKWHTERDAWKYEKLRQIYIQKNIFNDESIPDEHSNVAIEYLATSKGHARQVIIESAEAALKEIEEKITDENRDELTTSSKYKRAREILQSMQD